MPVDPLLPGNLPPSTIGSTGNSRPLRPEDTPTKVRDLDGTIHVMTRSNARDKVRLDGWKIVPENERPKAEDAPPKVAEVNADIEDLGEEEVGGNREPTELDHLRAKYAEKSGKQPDMRWGKKVLQEKIDLLD